ncbi:MAG TPA: HD domain-containing protein [Candidatus Heimdallarchaeota archaeon]|nr:HD domain-containing protein [Candidatus Heimdallarchaeota archaeon]
MTLKLDFRDKALFIEHFGEDVYIVGGYVRDKILGCAKDEGIDILITHFTIEQIIDRLMEYGKVDQVGKSFGIIKFNTKGKTYDIALPRKDLPSEAEVRGHKDFIISSDPNLPLEEDLKRRDFRCNSIAVRLSDGEVNDPLDGLEDIKQKIIRLTNRQAFPEDPLRVLRAARFASVLGFSIDPDIYDISKTIDLAGLSIERVNEEFFRILLESPMPSVGLEELFMLDALHQLFPELYRLTLSIQDSIFHPEKDRYGHHTVWQHTKITVDQAKRLAEKRDFQPQKILALLLAALYHDIGKASTAQWEFKRGRMVIINYGHDIASEKMTEQIFDRFKIYSWNGYDLRKTVLSLIRCHHRASELWQNRDVLTKKAFNRLAADVNGEIEMVVLLDAADRAGRSEAPVEDLDEETQWLLDKFEELDISNESIKPLILGRDLIEMGVSPGPGMGKILDKLYQKQLDNDFETKEEGLKVANRLLKKTAD